VIVHREVGGSVDQGYVREGLREVPEQAIGLRVVLSRVRTTISEESAISEDSVKST
jgi:hypothetical protein